MHAVKPAGSTSTKATEANHDDAMGRNHSMGLRSHNRAAPARKAEHTNGTTTRLADTGDRRSEILAIRPISVLNASLQSEPGGKRTPAQLERVRTCTNFDADCSRKEVWQTAPKG
jgi:hypothetical protein